MSSRRLQDISSGRLQDVLKTNKCLLGRKTFTNETPKQLFSSEFSKFVRMSFLIEQLAWLLLQFAKGVLLKRKVISEHIS